MSESSGKAVINEIENMDVESSDVPLSVVPSTNSCDVPPSVGEEKKSGESTGASLPTQRQEKKLTSIYWQHFSRERDKDGNSWAICKYCFKHVPGDTAKVGTNPMKRHLEHCFKYKQERRKYEKKGGQQIIKLGAIKTKGTCSIEAYSFDEEKSTRDLAEAIIIHEYPFSIVNHQGFRKFVRGLRPQFKFMSRQTITKECKKVYRGELNNIYEDLGKNESRVTITSDIWRSCQIIDYLVMTAHYIDNEWRLQKRILNFAKLESRHTGERIAAILYEKCIEWNIDRKLCCVVLDNCNANDVAARKLKSSLSFKRSLLLDGEFFHIRCCAHILNLIAQDGLEMVVDVVHNIRESARYVRSSTQRAQMFYKHAQQLNAPKKKLILDCVTRWNSTFKMIEVALQFKDVLNRVASLDPCYINYPSDVDWENVRMIKDCLKVFYGLTVLFSGSTYPTSNLFFRRICELKVKLDRWCENESIFYAAMARKMKAKFDKYWEKANLFLAIACVLDPRFKMKPIDMYFLEFYKSESAPLRILEVNGLLLRLYDEYALEVNGSSDNGDDRAGFRQSSESGEKIGSSSNEWDHDDAFMSRLDKYIEETSRNEQSKAEYDLYLEENVVKGQNIGSFDVLAWWQKNASRFPILSKIARDILAIPVSTVASESAFSTGGRTISQYRSSMTSETAQTLICSQDWLRNKYKDSEGDGVISSSIFDMTLEEEENDEDETETIDIA